MRTSRDLKYWIATLILLTGGEASATGETFPISIEFDERRQVSYLSVDTDAVTAFEMRAELYRDGELVERYEVETPRLTAKGARDYSAVSIVPFEERQKGMKLDDGAYAEKLVVEGRWKDRTVDRPLTVTLRNYFLVREGTVVPISDVEYDRIADDPRLSIDEYGEPIIVNTGRSLAEDSPLEKTQMSKDSRIGPFDGLEQEETDRKSPAGVQKQGSANSDDSERDED